MDHSSSANGVRYSPNRFAATPGFTFHTQSPHAATDAYRTEQDTVGALLAECCTLDADVSVDGQGFYAAYRGWADGNGIRPLSNRNLWEKLRERELTDRPGAKNRKTWFGIGLL